MRFPRALAGVAVAVLAPGCTSDAEPSPTTLSPEVSTSAPPTTVAPLSAPVRYQPIAGEPAPEVKQLASDVVQALATYESSATPLDEARRRLAGLAVVGDIAAEAGALLAPDVAARGDIVYPQLGGLTAQRASVMVVLLQRIRGPGGDSATSRTVDVRLDRPAGSSWSVTSLASTGGEPPGTATPLSTLASDVLAHKNIDMADSARWDIQAGRIADRLLALLVELAATHSLRLTVLATGHPHNVFASANVSNHTVGRAVDIWAVDGRPVVDQRQPDGALTELARSLLARGVTELGGPWDLDGPGGASFTNTVHQDHLHLAFDAA
ncbi:MAG: hypothetical protein ACRD1K_14345 [Acidimicrobiales bacterium]